MTPVQAYLDYKGIVALAKAQGVDVIHPGWAAALGCFVLLTTLHLVLWAL